MATAPPQSPQHRNSDKPANQSRKVLFLPQALFTAYSADICTLYSIMAIIKQLALQLLACVFLANFFALGLPGTSSRCPACSTC